MTIRELIENKSTLDYQKICTSLIQTFRVDEKVNWESVLPAQQQQEYFDGESLRLIAEHPILSKQKDIRPIALKKGSISQMLFFYVCLNDSSLPKKKIQDVTKKFISGGDANRYIIWFFGNKENTQLKLVLSAKEGKKVVLKTLPFAIEQPYYKTYTYILDKVNEEVNQLFIEPTDLWKALWKAFDISVINTKFYNEIRDAFNDLGKQLNKKGTPFTEEIDRVQFSIRLIGRIIFCWFLKCKEVLHDAAISSAAVKAHSQKNYYHYLLEPLFFDVLNTPEKERKGDLPKIIAHYPFLNGGLFEAQGTDYKQHLLLNIDNDWFYNLFSKTMERYNFTVDENSSSNAEIAIDPEMLGRIFENLLAEQNPETGDSARKATGSFYTPREIVDYMVEQSVSEFLRTSLVLDEKTNTEIEDFVHTQILSGTLAAHEEKISNELSKIKVLDPACGSGAFPIGILQKIVALKQQLHPKAKNYKLKLDTIQNAIYGVDIQSMAVELSRLRCWLSLVVDEDPKDIKALPNLDFKFVCADSLMEVGKINYQLDLSKSAEKIEELKELRTEFFIASGKRKRELEKKFKQIQNSLNNNFLEWDGKSKMIENLARWKPFDNHKTEWFDAFWMFGLNDGFDIVIANPPYLCAIAQNPEQRELLSNSTDYTTLYQKWDIYVAFIERGIRLSKKGLTCMIIPYPVTNQTYAKKLREFLHTENDLVEITNLSGNKIFDEAIVTNCILFVKNGLSENQKIRVSKLNDNSISVVDSVQKTDLVRDEKTFVWDLSNKKSLLFNGEKFINLGDYCFISKGMVLNSDEVKSKGLFAKTDLISDIKTKVNCMDYTEAKFIEKYKINKIFFLEWGTKRVPDLISRPTFPELYERPKIMVSKIGRIKATVDYTNIYCDQTIRVLVLWNDLKGVKNKSIENSVKRYQTNSRKVLEEISSQVSLKYLLAIINSKLADTLLDQIRGKGNIDINPEYLKNIPIAKTSMGKQKVFESIIDFIFYLKENETPFHQSISDNLFVKQLEEIIDGMVSELYFEEEMKAMKVNIIDLVGKELAKETSKDTAERIYSFYKSVSHPDNEIRNRILSFAIASPDIFKTNIA